VRILVVGAGAVGSVLAARLASSGAEVEVVGRPDHVRAISDGGLRIEGTDPAVVPLRAFASLDQARPPDLVALTVKAFDLDASAAALGERFPDLVPTLLPQNGLTAERTASAALRRVSGEASAPWLVRAVNSIPVTLVGPGLVRQAGVGELVVRAPDPNDPAREATARWAETLRNAGVPVRITPDLDRELWRKAIVNAAINPVTALHGIPNGLVTEPPYHEEATALLREAQRAAAAAGFPFTDRESDAELARVATATAANRSSMLQDRERGRPTEVDAISGEIVRVAAAHGIDLPATRRVIERLTVTVGPAARRTQPS
jgi:2-dehydropantoate 2-reductase